MPPTDPHASQAQRRAARGLRPREPRPQLASWRRRDVWKLSSPGLAADGRRRLASAFQARIPGSGGRDPGGGYAQSRPNSAQRALCRNYMSHEALRGRRFPPERGSQRRGRSAKGIVGERVLPFRLAAAIR
ncbi:hypothetical protein J1605_004832 [Eschrichtius robustus]|uniref:Uncharacterized protein n=1 Tax=Eschrichtius robustus TaxID=9764 RepID=A0AB34HCC4_ESCRO|nr:hypothetical protein J1605_004832 [Eschrichtius robustus]